MATATWQGKVIAEAATADTVVVEGNVYFPIASVNAEYLQLSTHQPYAPGKVMRTITTWSSIAM